MSKEREISISDLFWRILRGWRLVIISAIVFTLLLTGYSYMKYRQAQETYKVQLEEYEKLNQAGQDNSGAGSDVNARTSELMTAEQAELLGVTDKDLMTVNSAIEMNAVYNDYRDYFANSLLMGVDPYNERVALITLYVGSNSGNADPERIDAAAKSVVEYINSGDISADLKELFGGAEEKYVGELVSAKLGKSGDVSADATSAKVINVEVNENSAKMISIELILPSDVDGAQVKNAVINSIKAYDSTLPEAISDHEISVVTDSIVTRVDENLLTKRLSVITGINNYRNTLTSLVTSLPENCQAYVYGENSTENSTNAEALKPVAPSLSKKYIALGFVLGIFLAAVWIACLTIFSSRLVEVSELETYYGLRMIGKVQAGKEKKGIDRWLLSKQYRSEKRIDKATRLDIVCSNIELACEKEQVKRIALTGTEIEKTDSALTDAILAHLKGKGIEASVLSNICYDSAALRSLSEIGAAVVIETAGLSRYKEIEKELLELKHNDVRLIGCIGGGSF